jgi:PAS domain S-box-containing protein
MVGYSSDELVGQSARILYPSEEEFNRVGEEKYAQIREQGAGTVETRWKRKDGSIIDVLLSSTPIDPVDPSVAVTFTALDITDRKQAKRSLRESEERFHNVYNTAPLAFIVWDINTHVTDWNKKAEEVFGWSKKEVVDFNFFDFLIPEKDRPHVEDIVDALLKNICKGILWI